MTNSRRETVILKDSFERARKNYIVEKKNSWKNPIRKKSYDHFSENIFQKKIENFQKKKFQKCYFIFKHGEKKKFFFWKIFRPRFRPKFWKCHILLAARILRKIFPKFFFIHIILTYERLAKGASVFRRHFDIVREPNVHCCRLSEV